MDHTQSRRLQLDEHLTGTGTEPPGGNRHSMKKLTVCSTSSTVITSLEDHSKDPSDEGRDSDTVDQEQACHENCLTGLDDWSVAELLQMSAQLDAARRQKCWKHAPEGA